MDFSNLTLGIAFLAGLGSFLSPCVFSLVPAYLGYLGGRSAASAARGGNPDRWQTFSHALAFVLGFSVIFVLLGLATSALSGLIASNRQLLSKIGGIVVIIFGIHMTGLVRIPFLEYDLRPQTVPDRNRGYLASALMGVFFSAGWSPCVGPILGSILTVSALSSSSMAQGAALLTAYSAGLALPFLFASTQISLITNVIRKHGKVMRYVEIGMGVLMIAVGILLFSGKFAQLASLAFFFDAIDEAQMGRYLLLGLVGLLVLGLIPAAIARQKGRGFLDWWFFGSSLFPVALVAALLIQPKAEPTAPETEGEEKISLDSQSSTP